MIHRNLVEHGFGGTIHPVNPRYESIAGLRCVPRVRDLEQPVDLVAVAVNADLAVDVVREAAALGVGRRS